MKSNYNVPRTRFLFYFINHYDDLTFKKLSMDKLELFIHLINTKQYRKQYNFGFQ